MFMPIKIKIKLQDGVMYKKAYFKSQFLLSGAQWDAMNERQCVRRNGGQYYRCDPKYYNKKKWFAKQT